MNCTERNFLATGIGQSSGDFVLKLLAGRANVSFPIHNLGHYQAVVSSEIVKPYIHMRPVTNRVILPADCVTI